MYIPFLLSLYTGRFLFRTDLEEECDSRSDDAIGIISWKHPVWLGACSIEFLCQGQDPIRHPA